MLLGARETRPTDYDSRNEEWFRQCRRGKGSAWIRLPHLPHSERNAITTAIPVFRNGTLRRRRQHRDRGRSAVALPHRRPDRADRQRRDPRSDRLCRRLSRCRDDPASGRQCDAVDRRFAGRDAMFRVAADYLAKARSCGYRHPPADPDQGRRRPRRARLFHRPRAARLRGLGSGNGHSGRRLPRADRSQLAAAADRPRGADPRHRRYGDACCAAPARTAAAADHRPAPACRELRARATSRRCRRCCASSTISRRALTADGARPRVVPQIHPGRSRAHPCRARRRGAAGRHAARRSP